MANERIQIADLSPLTASSAVLTPNGYLSIPARIARDGVQEYYAIEMGGLFPDREWDDIIRLYRPPEEVFSADSLASFNRLPVTNNHPWEDVSAANWREHAVGMTEGTAARDGRYVSQTLLITDASAVNDVQRGRRELSAGWSFVPDMTPGVTPDGQPYDLIAREIRGNHIAIVDTARCGPGCRAGDAAKSPALAARLKDSRMCKCGQPDQKPKDQQMTTRTIAVDGLNVETTEAGAVALQKLIAERDEARTKLAAAEAKAAADAAAHAAAIAAKDAQIEEAKKAIPDSATLEQMARDHADIISKAKALLPALDSASKDAAAIRKEVVLAKMGDAAKGYTDDQIKVAFDILAKDAKPGQGDPIVPSGSIQITAASDSPLAARARALGDAWKKRPAA
jgi:hypothetical protein